mgnify:CR=1 FL=1
MRALGSFLRKDLWAPEVAGIGLGIVYILGVWLAHQTPGTTGTLFKISALAGAPLTANDPMNLFFSMTHPPITQTGMTWQAWMLVGVFLGALVSARLSGGFRLRWLPLEQWADVFGPSVRRRWLVAFLGGGLLAFGAGLAGGCTSGLALAGGVQLSPAAFLFIPAVFISGTVTQMIVYRRRY